MPTKLPAYFEKYLEERFTEVYRKIDDLKLHVNDELFELRKGRSANQANIHKIWMAILGIVLYHTISEDGGKLFSFIKGVFSF